MFKFIIFLIISIIIFPNFIYSMDEFDYELYNNQPLPEYYYGKKINPEDVIYTNAIIDSLCNDDGTYTLLEERFFYDKDKNQIAITYITLKGFSPELITITNITE